MTYLEGVRVWGCGWGWGWVFECRCGFQALIVRILTPTPAPATPNPRRNRRRIVKSREIRREILREILKSSRGNRKRNTASIFRVAFGSVPFQSSPETAGMSRNMPSYREVPVGSGWRNQRPGYLFANPMLSSFSQEEDLSGYDRMQWLDSTGRCRIYRLDWLTLVIRRFLLIYPMNRCTLRNACLWWNILALL